MRFAYIDSQGNEVSIPSVDALALRIELGAIGPDTELYDAQGDRWGPAESHEIYHTLARDVSGEDFLIPTPPPQPQNDAAPPEPMETAPPEPPASEPPSVTPNDLGLTLAPVEDTDEARGDFSRSGTGAPGTSEEPESDAFELAPPEEDLPMGGTDRDEDALEDADALGFGMDPEEPTSADDALDLEPSLDFGGGSEDDFGTGLELEPPMSDFDPKAPPAWMEQDGPARDDGESLMDFSAGLDEPEEETPRRDLSEAGTLEPRPRPTPRPSRPPPRRPAPRRSYTKPIVTLLVLGVLGYGGWWGWRQYGDRLVPEAPRPEVVIPPIPAELEPPMRRIAEDALVRMFQRVEARSFPEGTPREPSEDWLAGIYLGNASDFPDVRAFWTGIRGFADRLRAEEAAVFHDAYVALADSSDVAPDAVPVIVERADSGFAATQGARGQTYELLGALADASLALHEFLLVHEADIQYTPARSFSGNPVEEAVPATQEVGDEMWALVEDITNALDRLGTLDRVSRERLSAVVLERIRETGIR